MANYEEGGATLRDVTEYTYVIRIQGWAVGDGGKIIKIRASLAGQIDEIDTELIQFDLSYDLFGVSFVDELHGWFCGVEHNAGEKGVVVRTTDGRTSWITQYIDALACYDVAFCDTMNGYRVVLMVRYLNPLMGVRVGFQHTRDHITFKIQQFASYMLR